MIRRRTNLITKKKRINSIANKPTNIRQVECMREGTEWTEQRRSPKDISSLAKKMRKNSKRN